jgi:predicted nucleic-acid-binding protein
MPILRFEHKSVLQQFTLSAQKNRYDLADLLIACSAKIQGCETVLTFDKKVSKFKLFELAK